MSGSASILLSGAAGLVGRTLAPLLAREGYAPRLLRHRAPVETGMEVADAGLEDEDRLRAALEGVGAIVHAAGRMDGSTQELEQVNCEGSERLFRLAERAGISRVVFLSTSAVYSPGSFREIDEDYPTQAASAYGRSKRTAELLGRELLGERLTVLRPVTLYRTGPCPFLHTLRALLCSAAVFPHNGGEDTPLDLLHLDDLCAAILAALEGRGGGGTFHLCGPDKPGFRSIVLECTARLGLEPRWAPLDSGAPFDPALLEAATLERTISCARARRELGYLPRRRWSEECRRLPLR